MMDLIKDVKTLAEQEYGRASKKFGALNHSDYESYAIILEEFEEASDESCRCASDIREFWEATKDKEGMGTDKMNCLDTLYHDAVCAASEFIQVAAMAHKAKQTIKERKKE